MNTTSEQRLILTAALAPLSIASEAWRNWENCVAGIRPEQIDQDSQWILPMVYRRIGHQQSNSPLLSCCRRIYLQNWYKNHVLFHESSAALKRLSQRIIFLKGIAMTLRYYRDFGVRPCSSFDIAIEKQTLPLFTRALKESGWLHESDFIFVHPHTHKFIIHIDASFEASDRSQFLNPTAQLLQILSCGPDWDQRSSLFWIIDAATVIQSLLDFPLNGLALDPLQTERLEHVHSFLQ